MLSDAIAPLLGTAGGYHVTTAGSAVVVTVGPVTLSWAPGSARIGAAVTVPAGLPGVESLAASVTVDTTGLTALDIAAGPASLAACPLTIRPFARVIAGWRRRAAARPRSASARAPTPVSWPGSRSAAGPPA